MVEVQIEPRGFRVKHHDILIVITQINMDKWNYVFYRENPNIEGRAEDVCAPVDISGLPWMQSRYKDTILTKILMKALYSQKEETQKLVDEITMELYKNSDQYNENQITSARTGYDYNNTIDGIPTNMIKYKMHPAMDIYGGKLFLGYRFIDEIMQKKEWMIDSEKRVWTYPELLDELKVVVKDKSIIGDQRWNNLDKLHEKAQPPNNLFILIRSKLTNYIWFSNPLSYDILTLWIMGTYMFWAFDSYPYIHLSGTADSGKSRVQRLTSCIAFNGYFTESISNSSIFRYVEEMRATLNIDEQEFLNSENALETISILNSGYHKAGNATRQEPYTDKDGNRKFQTLSFSTYSPKMLSGIRGLDKTLQTRSINIPMKPTTDKQYSRKEVDTYAYEWQTIRNQLYIWALNSYDEIVMAYDAVREQDIDIKNRMWQKYHALLALAYYFKTASPGSQIQENVIKFIQEDQLKNIEFDDFKIDLAYKVLYRLVTKLPNPKGHYSLKLIRDECCSALGMQQPYDLEQPNLLFIKNIHTTLNNIGFKTFPLAGNFRGIHVVQSKLEEDAKARGINLLSPIITM